MEKLEGKKILVTGFTGRLGGAFAERLAKDNIVTGAALVASDEELALWRSRGVDPYVIDLADDDYGSFPDDFDYVVHTAAAVYPRTFDEGMRANAEVPALLMKHTRNARSFLHVSTAGVYLPNPDPFYRATEDDFIGGMTLMGHYTGTKTAGEGAVRAMARAYQLPTIICRMDTQYGTYSDGGLPVKVLANVIQGVPTNLPGPGLWAKALVHQDDLFSFIAPCLEAATTPASVVNWAGDDLLVAEDWIGFLGELVGEKPLYHYDPALSMPGGAPSAERRKSITGPTKVSWQDGLRSIVEFWEPRIRSGEYQKRGA